MRTPLRARRLAKAVGAGVILNLLSVASNTVAEPDSREIVFYNRSFTQNIQVILQTTIERSLELTKKEYGEYQLAYYPTTSSDERIEKLSRDGEQLHLYFSTPKILDDTQQSHTDIDIPFLTNALGLRVILTKKQRASRFDHIKNHEDLRDFYAGIGHTWAAKKIFEHRGIPFRQALLTEKLLPMLEKDRFDYIAISTLDDIESLGPIKDNQVTALDNLMLYYPIPVQLHISNTRPELVSRLKKGLERFISSGEATALIDAEMSERNILQGEARVRLLMIKNPLYDEQRNQAAFKNLTEQFPRKFITVYQP
ncbi:MAG TPA: hypothetical protein VIC26_07205 [Marinagarivorans sp.]